MKKFDFRSLLAIEIVTVISIGFLLIDFLPRNHNEFLRICSTMWPNDANQLKLCMQPYFRQITFNKYTIGVAVGIFVIAPIFYIINKKVSSHIPSSLSKA